MTWNPANLFSGTASYYSRYRPGYPEALFRLLIKKFSLSLSSRVLDLGCGTGQVALPLAPYVAEVIAIDPQPEMLEEAQAQARHENIHNIRWLPGESGNLTGMSAIIGDIDLTVIARAFHWMNREQTLQDLYTITRPGGGIAIIWDSGPRDGAGLPWKQVIDLCVKRWLGEARKAGTQGTYTHPTKRFETFLQESAFRNPQKVVYNIERSWSIDRIIGYLFSTSSSSPPVLGDKKELFETDVRRCLRELEPSGVFKEPVAIEMIMARK